MDSVISATAACVPRGWRTAILELDVAYSSFTKVRSIRHKLHNPAAHARVSNFSKSLFQATTELHSIFTEYDMLWVRAKLTMNFNAAGRLTGSKMTYDYNRIPPK